jgi:DNA polymerase delta subunit 2
MLEDESGRIRLVGDRIKAARLVTGVIVGALGVETPNGDFEVVDICYPEMAPQKHANAPEAEEKMDVDGAYFPHFLLDADLTLVIAFQTWTRLVRPSPKNG